MARAFCTLRAASQGGGTGLPARRGKRAPGLQSFKLAAVEGFFRGWGAFWLKAVNMRDAEIAGS